MKLSHKILLAIGLGAFSIFLYYLLFVSVEKKLFSVCKKYFCLEIMPIGDFIAIFISIIGLYFVVNSLNDWKVQDKYNNAKNRVAELNELELLLLDFAIKMNNIYRQQNLGRRESMAFINFGETKHKKVLGIFEAYMDDSNIIDIIDTLDRNNTNSKNCLYQGDFDFIIEQAASYVKKCRNDAENIKEVEGELEDYYSDKFEQIDLLYRDHFNAFKDRLNTLNNNLNKILNH